PLRVQVALEGVLHADVVAAPAGLVGGVPADIGQEQVEETVAVEVEEDRAGGVADVVQPRLLGDVLEAAVAVVEEQMVALADGGDEEVRVAVAVDVGEGGGDADLVGEGDAGFGRDVAELAAPQVLPELVVPELGDEVEVQQAVAVHV